MALLDRTGPALGTLLQLVLMSAPLFIARKGLSYVDDVLDQGFALQGTVGIEDMAKNIGAHGNPTEEAIGLSRPCPALFNFGVEVIEELVGLVGNAELSAASGFDHPFHGFGIKAIALLGKLPMLDKGVGIAPDHLEVVVEQVRASLHGQTMPVVEAVFAGGGVGLAVGEDL